MSGIEEEKFDIGVFSVGSGDLLVFRGLDDDEVINTLAAEMQKNNPEWKGLVISLPKEAQLDKIPTDMARQLYESLRGVFEDVGRGAD